MRATARLALPRKLVSAFAGATRFIVENEGGAGDFLSIHQVFEFPEDGLRVDGGAQSPLIEWDGGELWITALVTDFTLYRVLPSERGRGVQQRRKVLTAGAGGGGGGDGAPSPPGDGGGNGGGNGGDGAPVFVISAE